jgi:Concanavalin A-like lectin/glucanases superfamily
VAASYGLWTASSGGIEFYIWDGGNLVRSGSAASDVIWDGRWHNLSATFDGTRARLYLDGKSLGEPAGSPSAVVYDMADGTATIGGYRGSCDLLFNGDLDEVMMFDTVLPIEQIWSRWGFILGRPTFG